MPVVEIEILFSHKGMLSCVAERYEHSLNRPVYFHKADDIHTRFIQMYHSLQDFSKVY